MFDTNKFNNNKNLSPVVTSTTEKTFVANANNDGILFSCFHTKYTVILTHEDGTITKRSFFQFQGGILSTIDGLKFEHHNFPSEKKLMSFEAQGVFAVAIDKY